MNILECINKNTINNIFNFVLGTSYSMSFINNKISKYNVYVNYITKNENGINASLKVINENIKINVREIHISDDRKFISLHGVKSDAAWMQNILNDFVEHKQFKLPDNTLLKNFLSIL